MSWIDREEKMLNASEYNREPVDIIKCYFLFVNNDNNIEKVSKEEVELFVNEASNNSVLSKQKLLELVRTQKESFNNSKFLYRNLLKFNVPLESDILHEYLEDIDDDGSLLNEDTSYNFLTEISLIDDVVFEPSVYFFHSLCSLYFIFHELPKPILKLNGRIGSEGLKKRVTIKLNKGTNHHTRKNIS